MLTEGYLLAVRIDDPYLNDWKPSLLNRHVIHILKNMVTQRFRVNICSYTWVFPYTYKLANYQTAIYQRVCITDNQIRF